MNYSQNFYQPLSIVRRSQKNGSRDAPKSRNPPEKANSSSWGPGIEWIDLGILVFGSETCRSGFGQRSRWNPSQFGYSVRFELNSSEPQTRQRPGGYSPQFWHPPLFLPGIISSSRGPRPICCCRSGAQFSGPGLYADESGGLPMLGRLPGV